MQKKLRARLCTISVMLNTATGGKPEPICARLARRYGTNCIFCRLIAWLLKEPDHCEKQIGT